MKLRRRITRRGRRWLRSRELSAFGLAEATVGSRISRFAPARLRASAPRGLAVSDTQTLQGPIAVDLELARPIHAPAARRGSSTITGPPPADAAALRRLIARTRRRTDVQVPAAWVSDPTGAVAVATLSAAGAPLRLSGRPDGAALIGPDSLAAIVSPSAPDVGGELRSVRLRRTVLREHGPRATGDPSAPIASVSVLLPSRRPDDVLQAVEQVGRQRSCDVELIVGLHGPGFSDGIDAEVAARWSGDLHVVRIDADTTLGEMLNVLTARATRGLIAKWDDDDWYGSDHLLDLVIAYDYSGAEVVGKFAEFVYIEELDLTVRRHPVGSETYTTAISGGALLMAADWLDTIGGWAPVPRSVDLRLLDATIASGGRSYRTHGFQYLLRRRSGVGVHTWSASNDYFVDDALERRDGLDLALADIGTDEP